MTEKKDTINFLLNKYMDLVVSLPYDPYVSIKYAISACIRFAIRASMSLNMSENEFNKIFEDEWKWNMNEAKKKNAGILN